MKKTKKHIVLAFIAILIAALAFGYAYLTTTLTISGVTDIDRNSWDVYFDNVQVTDGSVTGAQEIEAPTITSDTEVEFHVNLKKPGDFYEFTVEARNDGTIDAMINSVSKKLNNVEITTLPAYLNYAVTYDDDMEIQDNHLLAAESLETYKVRVEFKKNISASDLPSTAQSLTLSFGVEYVQADDTAELVMHTLYVYDQDSPSIYLNQALPNGLFTFKNNSVIAREWYSPYEDEYPYYLKTIIVNGKVYATFLEAYISNDFVSSHPGLNAGFYTFYAALNENMISTEEAFQANKTTALSMFDSSYCAQNGSYFNCNYDNIVVAEFSLSGYSQVGKHGCYCSYNNWKTTPDTICGCYT